MFKIQFYTASAVIPVGTKSFVNFSKNHFGNVKNT
jgi:hypothetical protein